MYKHQEIIVIVGASLKRELVQMAKIPVIYISPMDDPTTADDEKLFIVHQKEYPQ